MQADIDPAKLVTNAALLCEEFKSSRAKTAIAVDPLGVTRAVAWGLEKGGLLQFQHLLEGEIPFNAWEVERYPWTAPFLILNAIRRHKTDVESFKEKTTLKSTFLTLFTGEQRWKQRWRQMKQNRKSLKDARDQLKDDVNTAKKLFTKMKKEKPGLLSQEVRSQTALAYAEQLAKDFPDSSVKSLVSHIGKLMKAK